MRKDVYIINDAGSFSVVAADAVERIVNDNRSNDEAFVEVYEAALFAIEGDDYSVVRVVVNEPLTDVEEREWIARSRWRLKVEDGKVLVSGGFDPDCLAEWQDDGETEIVKEVDVPSGDYQVTFYTYLHSMNGALWLSDFYDKFYNKRFLPKIGPWFRKDHPDKPLPSWIAAKVSDEDLDEDDEWRPMTDSIKSGRLAVEREPVHWIGYLVHLTPFVEGAELDTPEDGWFDPKTGLRAPEKCPLGIPTDCTEDTEIRDRLEQLLES
jgi:hypothetical protein